jgi:hypothetical protein
MSVSTRSKVKGFEGRIDPKVKPFRICLNIVTSINPDKPDEQPAHPWDSLYAENAPARNARYKKRLDRGEITIEGYRNLCAEPIPNGFWKIPESDFPLDDC